MAKRPESNYDRINRLFDEALASWRAAGGCVRCEGLGRCEPDLIPFSAGEDEEIACPLCNGKPRAGRKVDWPAYKSAVDYQERCIPREGRWAMSTTVRGRLCGAEGAIVGIDESGNVHVVTESGEHVWLSGRYGVDPDCELLAKRCLARTNPARAWSYWLMTLDTHARNSAEAVDILVGAIQSSAQARDWLRTLDESDDVLDAAEVADLREALIVRQDQLAEQEPPEPARWVSTPNGWRLKGPAVRPGRVFVVKKGGVPQWVEISHVESDGLGVPAR